MAAWDPPSAGGDAGFSSRSDSRRDDSGGRAGNELHAALRNGSGGSTGSAAGRSDRGGGGDRRAASGSDSGAGLGAVPRKSLGRSSSSGGGAGGIPATRCMEKQSIHSGAPAQQEPDCVLEAGALESLGTKTLSGGGSGGGGGDAASTNPSTRCKPTHAVQCGRCAGSALPSLRL